MFRSPAHDIYLFTLILEDVSPVKLTIAGVNVPMGVTHSSGSVTSVTISRNMMSVVEKGQNVSIQFTATYIVDKLPYYWGGFSVSGYMDPVVAFSVARSTSMTAQSLVKYHVLILNTGQFDMETSTFTAPLDGIYYFSVSAGLLPHTILEVTLRVNGIGIFKILHFSTSHDDIETISGSTLLDLRTGDKVTPHLTKGHTYSSSEQGELSLLCFLYSPKTGPSIAWLMSKNTEYTVSSRSPLINDKVHVIEGIRLHNFSTIEIPVSGIYYVYQSVIVPLNTKAVSNLYANKVPIIELNLHRDAKDANGLISVSESFICQLKVGDKLGLYQDYFSSVVDTDRRRAVMFMGFLVKEIK